MATPLATGAQIRPGAADLPTLLLTVDYRVPLPAASAGTPIVVDYHDGNYPERSGWREITAKAGAGYRLSESNVPRGERSGALENYPAEPTVAPPQERSARLVILLSDPAAAAAAAAAFTQANGASAATRAARAHVD